VAIRIKFKTWWGYMIFLVCFVIIFVVIERCVIG
jgi:hypothetical protein